MKKSILKSVAFLSIVTLMASCSKDETPNTDNDGIQNGNETGIDCGGSTGVTCPDSESSEGDGDTNANTSENLEGELSEAKTLDASKAYNLTGSYIIKDGGKLTIPAGTVIIATGGTSSYIAVAQGGQIFVNGTAANPVVMTSGAANPTSSDWGGLVLCGKAPTNVGSTATSEVGDLTYGGTVSDDNSGVLKYLRVEYTGAAFNSSKEFNGVSFFGVGSGTTVEYVQSYNGGDDGIEFFGGTVNGKYLVSTNSEDDGIDFADGWQGNGEYWYISGAAKAGIEGSNNGDNSGVTPLTTTTLSNITVVGPVTEGALYFKEGGGKFTINNFYTKGINLGVKVKDTDTDSANRIEAGDLKITNMQFDAPVDGYKTTDYTGATQNFITVGENTGAGNSAAAPAWTAGWTKGL